MPVAGVPAAMDGHAVYATGERSVAEALGRSLLGPHRLRAEPGAGFWAALHAVPVGRLTVGYLAVGASTAVVLDDPPHVLVVAPTGPGAEVQSGQQRVAASARRAAVLPTGSPATIWCPPASVHLLVAIGHQALLAHLSRLLGRPLDRPLTFDLELDLLAGESVRWNAAIGVLHAELAGPRSLLRSGVGVEQLEELVMGSLLYGHRSTYSSALRRPARGGDHLLARAAIDHIDGRLDRPLGVGAVAAAVGVSTRTLQAVFKAELRTTPTTYIRDRRLDRVRADLAEAAPADGATVTEVATRWGICHLGRFAGEYRARFGESPSQTLRTRRAAVGETVSGLWDAGSRKVRPQGKEETWQTNETPWPR